MIGAVWGCPPGYDAVLAEPAPAFSLPALKPAAASALSELAARPAAALAALRSGWPPQELLRLMLLVPTFAFHGVSGEVATFGGRQAPETWWRARKPMTGRTSSVCGLVLAQDEEARIGDALASLAPLVDEVVVVDGGSKDGTVDIAREFGARIVVRPLDTFDRQRNAGMEAVRAPWTFSLDCDERLLPGAAEALKAATATTCDTVGVPMLALIGDDPVPTQWPSDGPKLFRSTLRFSSAVHEHVPVRSMLRMPLQRNLAVHWKSLANALANDRRYRRMLGEDVPTGPDDATDPRLLRVNVPVALWRTDGETHGATS